MRIFGKNLESFDFIDIDLNNIIKIMAINTHDLIEDIKKLTKLFYEDTCVLETYKVKILLVLFLRNTTQLL